MTWSFVDDSGVFSGRCYAGPQDALELNTPAGFTPVLGAWDPTRWRWNFSTEAAETYVPDKPEDTEFETYQWDEPSWSWVPVKTPAAVAADVRAERSKRMVDSDWVMLRAFRTGTLVPAEWNEYLQALADITLQEGFPDNVIWPVKPE